MKELTVLMISRVAYVEVTNLRSVNSSWSLARQEQSSIQCKWLGLFNAPGRRNLAAYLMHFHDDSLPSTRTTHAYLGRVEFRGGGTVGETLSTGVDSLVTELLPRLSVLPHYDLGN